VVVCYGYRTASFLIAAAAAKATGSALVLTTDAHQLSPREGDSWKVPVKRAILPRVFRMADAVLAPSTRTVRFLGSLGVPSDRVFLTPFAVDNMFFSEASRAADRSATRLEWGVPPEAPVALFVGKLVTWKRPGDLLEAAAQVDRMHVVYAGDGPLKRSLEARADELGMLPRAHFLGFVNQQQLPPIYAGADFLVLPSDHEPFGLVINEAFACGRPAVVSEACGAAGDLVVDGETGFIVPTGDIRALADRLRALADDRELVETMGLKASLQIDRWGPRENAEAFSQSCLELGARRRLSRERARQWRGTA
jgi:glycosyltransferase involved in cell wall biosynthesis